MRGSLSENQSFTETAHQQMYNRITEKEKHNKTRYCSGPVLILTTIQHWDLQRTAHKQMSAHLNELKKLCEDG